MRRLPPVSTLTDTLFPYTPLFRSTFDVTGVIGAGFDDGRGHVTAYAGYRKINQILQRDRDYGACTLAAASDTDAFSCSGSGTTALGTFRSEEHTSELQSLMRISYAVFCLKTTNKQNT